MNNKAWSHLPNAAHIDRILESLKTYSNIWTADFDAARTAAWAAAWDAARTAAVDASWAASRNPAWNAAWLAARKWTNAAWNAATCAISALIAWDDSSQFLKLDGDALEVYARLSDDPRAVLLLPAVRVFERIKELDSV